MTRGLTFALAEGGRLQGLGHDLKIAVRSIRLRPAFAAIVIGMLAVGIGGNAAIFGVYSSIFLRPLPFAESERLVDLDETAPAWSLVHVGISGPDSYSWAHNNSTFAAMAFFRDQSYNLADGGSVQRVQGAQVTHGTLDVFHLKPALGRTFRPDEDRPGGARVVLLADGLWRRLFHSDPLVLGRIVKLDGEPYEVIGVLPREALFPDRTEVWTPLAVDPTRNTGYYLNGVGRLRPDVSLDQARADLLRIHKARIPTQRVNETTSPLLTPLRDRYLGAFEGLGRALLGAVGIVLLITCVNIAALIMARGSSRAREVAIRTAIGASRARIVTQVLIEHAVLAAAGGAVGILLGAAALRVLGPVMPQDVPRWISLSLDARFALYSVAITAAAALVFGLAPALQAGRTDVRTSLHDAVLSATPPPARRATLGLLVVCEVALALTLAVGAALLVTSFHRVLHVDPGFRAANVLTFRISLPDATYPTPDRRVGYFDALLNRLRAMPGVQAAGATSAPPLGGQWGGTFEAEGGRGAGAHGENPNVLQVAVTTGYLDAIGMTLVDGRRFDERDSEAQSPMVAIVNETFARIFWGSGTPVGKRIHRLGQRSWYQVIGYLRDEKHEGLDRETTPSVFLPYREAMATGLAGDERALTEMTVAVRAAINPMMLVAPASEIVRRLDADVPMFETHTMMEQLDRSLWARRAASWLFSVFASVALLLASAGICGVVSYVVSQRTKEIGIRLALGARPDQVLGQVMVRGLALVSIGVVAGLAGAGTAAALLRTLLFGVSPRDPFIYAACVLGVMAVGLLATLVPARRAAMVDPLRALRFE